MLWAAWVPGLRLELGGWTVGAKGRNELCAVGRPCPVGGKGWAVFSMLAAVRIGDTGLKKPVRCQFSWLSAFSFHPSEILYYLIVEIRGPTF